MTGSAFEPSNVCVHPQPTDMTMSKVLSTQKTLKKWEFQSLLFPLKAQIPTVPSGTCFWACLHRVLWKSGESWRWGDEGGSLIPGSPPLPYRVWQKLLHSGPLVLLETMQVYFGSAKGVRFSRSGWLCGKRTQRMWPRPR